MARAFSTADADTLITAFRDLERRMRRIGDTSERQRTAAASLISAVCADPAQASEAEACLRNRDLSAPRTQSARQLLLALCRYEADTRAADVCDEWRRRWGETVRQALRRVAVGKSSLRWAFSGQRAKTEAERAYTYLSDLLAGDFPARLAECERDIARAGALTCDMAAAVLERDPEPMRGALDSIDGACLTADRPIPAVDRLLTSRGKILRDCDAIHGVIRSAESSCARQAAACAGRAVAEATMRQMRDMDTEALAQVRPGIRVKALKENGYRSVADVHSAPVYSLASARGIGSDSANAAKEAAAQIAQQVQSGIKLRLSADDRTPETGSLITALYRAILVRGAAGVYADTLSGPRARIASAVSALGGLRNVCRWIFATPDEKEAYADAWQELNGSFAGTEEAVSELQTRLESAAAVSPDAAWQAFAENPYPFYGMLEELVPDVCGGDSVYGLPEELAREIRDQSVFPQGLHVALRRYQEWGVKYILHQGRALLGDEMGLGKTVQAIAAMVSLRNTGASRFLVVCPASVLPNWCKEVGDKSELRPILIHGPSRQAAFGQWMTAGGVGVTSYETLGSLPFPEDFRFDLLVADEAHYVKNAGAKRSRDLRAVAEKAGRVLFMTGTALENRVDEMVSLIDVLQPDTARRIRGISFMAAAPQFRERVAQVYYRRKREDVLTELPDIIETKDWCTLTPAETLSYRQSVLRGDRTAIRRVSWTEEDLSRSSKARRMKEIIDEARDDGRKIIVFSFYLETIRRIREFLGDICTEPINGSVPVSRRQEIIDRFADMPAGSVLLAQIQAGGTGLNIQSASVVIICEPQLKPSTESQAISRAYRMGQVRSVLVYRLLAADTIDERMDELLSDKQTVFRAFADPSVAAEETEAEERKIDDKTFGLLIQEEIDRINSETAAENPAVEN